ncbi:MAG: class I SAM-dependent methyltransferase [Ardenticatenaceae bacterium]|nr:class I SAM-dependent methyltransferase [Ardenticatenaceae bacterium]
MYDQIINNLRNAYNQSAEQRDQGTKSTWKLESRQVFLEQLQREGKTHLLEIGAGPGADGEFFQDNNLTVTCTDLSPEMVRLCRAKGLDAHVMDFLNLDFSDAYFDAVFALNCLLHVPKTDLPRTLQAIRRVLKPGGLMYTAVYGGFELEEVWQDDSHKPKRFFAFYTDEQVQAVFGEFFTVEQFTAVDNNTDNGLHSQILILRRP